MTEVCHRCGEETAPHATYCGNCGAPQLYLREYGQENAETGETTGTTPPPPPGEVDWPRALGCAGVVAMGAALLSLLGAVIPAAGLAVWIWVASGAVLAVGLYARRRPAATVGPGSGARIGLVAGLAMCVGLAVVGAGGGLLARFGQRSMAGFDRDMTARLHAQVAAMAMTNPIPPEMLTFVYSPEFVAGMMLVGFAILGVLIILLSAAGGAFAGAMRARTRG